MAMKVKDENGNIFPHLKEAFEHYELYAPGGAAYMKMKVQGMLKAGGHTFYPIDGPVQEKTAHASDPRWEKIRSRYSEKEIEAIVKGEGIAQSFIPYPEITLEGNHHSILVMSDTHIGSVYSPKEWIDTVAEYANNHEIDCILHCGDLVEGMKIGRMGTQIYELSEIGYEAQRDEAARLMSKFNAPIYIISGNHDRFFSENFGCDIVQAVCNMVPNMTKIGDDSADIDVDGCTIRLFHGGDGSSYAISYSLQKLVESINGGHKPNILIRGHIHKFCTLFTRNIHAISCPALQAQTSFMRGKKLEAHIGFLVLDFDTKDGSICNLSVRLFPFYA